MKRTFLAAIHPEHGSLGWQPVGVPHADPIGGMAVAHDVLEHFAGDDGGVEAEFQALGAALWIRGQGHYWSNYTQQDCVSWGQNTAADVPDLMSHVVHEGFTLRAPAQPVPTLGDEAEQELRRFARSVPDWLNDYDEECREAWQLGKDHALAWIRQGYRRAARRFRGLDPSVVCELFHQIEMAADQELRGGAEEGSQLVVSVNLKRLDVRVHRRDAWEIEE